MKPYISSVTIVLVSVDNNLISLQCAINLHDVHCTYWKKCTTYILNSTMCKHVVAKVRFFSMYFF